MFTTAAETTRKSIRWGKIACRYCVGIATALRLCVFVAVAEEAQIAVAANFLTTAEVLAQAFEADTSHHVTLASGSTGGLYAQILQGAPYDVLLAADQARPARLEADGRVAEGRRFIYALGRLSLWSVRRSVEDGPTILRDTTVRYLAIANPDLAPYGVAAQQALDHYGLWPVAAGKLVLGQNIGQAAAMVASGNAELGLVATSFLITQPRGGSRWDIPAEAYDPIRQDAVLLDGKNEAARAFLDFLQSEEGRTIIRSHGYEVPE